MPWRDPASIPLTRIDVVSQVPSVSGVFAIRDGESYLLVGESWNLKARLLELMALLQDFDDFQVVFELCPENERFDRKEMISAALLPVTARPVEISGT